jgi:hypothetical protein
MLIIKSRRKRSIGLNEPLKHESHKKPVTRRDFLAQGFLTGAATVVAPAMLGTLLNSRAARAQTVPLSPDIEFLARSQAICDIQQGAGRIPFICIDLAGGANIAGSNVLVGKEGGQMDFLSTQGYSKLGLPGNMLPNNATTNFINTEFGLAFHSDSAFLRGMLEKTSATTRAGVNGCVIAARSENDTGNNPHNPMYGIAKTGSRGELLTLIGSQNSDSGGNSMAPAALMNPANRPTKIDRTSDATGLVDTGALGTLFKNPDDSPDTASTVAVMEQMARISEQKLGTVDPQLTTGGAELETQVKCGYVKTADTVSKFSSPAAINPAADPDITGTGGVFGANFGNDREFEKTAAVMKLVIEGYAGAGTISMGGFDYHTGDRSTGELRDLRAGRCMGAILEFAARRGKPVMLYVFSDGSLSSNGMVDSSVDGRGKGQWTGDNQQTAASFFLVYNPPTLGGRPALMSGGVPARHQQLGYYSANGDVVTSSSPAANNVNLLVQTVLLNYMALHGEAGNYNNLFDNALGAGTALDSMIAFQPIR